MALLLFTLISVGISKKNPVSAFIDDTFREQKWYVITFEATLPGALYSDGPIKGG